MPLFRRAPTPKKGASGKARGKRSLFGNLLHLIRQASLLFLGLTLTATLVFRFVNPPATPLMLLRSLSAWAEDKPASWRKAWTPLHAMAPEMLAAVVASEDQRFFEHHGFDMKAIRSALENNRGGRRLVGASTITQQTAKNLFLWPGRNWVRKALEAYFTIALELLWSKRRILEVYLNVAETGMGVYGMPAAARLYFSVDVGRIQAHQAAWIAACLPNPLAWNPHRAPRHVVRRQAWILRQMARQGPLPPVPRP